MAKQQKANTSSSIASPDLSFIGSKDEHAETRNIASRERVRSELDDEVARFLDLGRRHVLQIRVQLRACEWRCQRAGAQNVRARHTPRPSHVLTRTP